MSRYHKIESYMLDLLRKELPADLFYHSFDHVTDVLQAAERIGKAEKISDAEMELLKVAVVFHDSGFMVSPKDHEETGCRLVKELLPDYGYTPDEIERICRLIMATRFPHNPSELLEEIICDADLDYLGSDQYFPVSDRLYKELKASGVLMNDKEWNLMQKNFLSAHRYFTGFSQRTRNMKKMEHLEKIKELNREREVR
jgi:predicted metal-dependent HD superfamily phosphohydrolase